MRKRCTELHGLRCTPIEALETRRLLSAGLDPTFGSGGYIAGPVPVASPNYSEIGSALQSDGKLLFTGLSSVSGELDVRRYLVTGQLDTTFGSNGIMTIDNSSDTQAFIAEMSGGEIAVADANTLYLLTSSGQLDSSFGTGGQVALGTFSLASLTAEGNQILLGGSAGPLAEIQRYNLDGTLDPSFGTGGIVSVTGTIAGTGDTAEQSSFTQLFVTQTGSIAAGLNATVSAVQSDSLVYLFNGTGALETSFGSSGNGTAVISQVGGAQLIGVGPGGTLLYESTGALNRLTAAGLADSTFAAEGFAQGQAAPAAVEADGSVLIGASSGQPYQPYVVIHYSSTGTEESSSSIANWYGSGQILALSNGNFILVNGNSFYIAEFSAAGAIQSSFGIGGQVAPIAPPNPPSQYTSVVTQSDRKVVAAGIAFNGTVAVFDLTRYNANGSLDTSFGTAGVAQAQVGFDNVTDITLLVEPDGKIVAAGDVSNANGADGFAVSRFNSNGSLDTTFGDAGTLLLTGQQGPKLLWQGDKLLVGSDTVLQRLDANGSTDASFHTIDFASLAGAVTSPAAEGIFAVQPDQKILICTVSDDEDDVIFRYTANGVLDSSFGKNGAAHPTATEYGAPPLAMVVESNGTIVELAAPGVHLATADTLTALNSNGTIDIDFGSQGSLSIPGAQAPVPLILAPGNQLIISEAYRTSDSPSITGEMIWRYARDGAPDVSFGTDGAYLLDQSIVSSNGGTVSPTQGTIATLDNAGRLVLVGSESIDNTTAPALIAVDTNNHTAAGHLAVALSGQTPPTVIVGQPTKISQLAVLTNATTAAITEPITAQLFWFSTTTANTNPTAVKSISETVHLRAKGRTTVRFAAVSLPASFPTGTYYLVVQVTDQSGNTVSASSAGMSTLETAQINFTGVFLKTPKPGKGGRTTMTFSVTNTGNIPAAGSLAFNIERQGDISENLVLVAPAARKIDIKPGKSTNITEVLVLPAGTYFLVVQLDPKNKFGESDPSTNVFGPSVVIVVP